MWRPLHALLALAACELRRGRNWFQRFGQYTVPELPEGVRIGFCRPLLGRRIYWLEAAPSSHEAGHN